MNKPMNPNARCFCGSGKKFKNCHGLEAGATMTRKKIPVGYIFAGVILLLIAGALLYKTSTKPSGQVWSEEHGHYHDAP